ncbi:MAG: very short patch repair endonuclease [Pseudomonadota bacterium]
MEKSTLTRHAAQSDTFSPEQRSAIMRSVKSANTKPEVRLRRALHRRGLRYRLNVRHLPGSPDLVFPRYRAVIFVHGCFWHGHDCPRGARQPKNNAEYWRAKIQRNKDRDASVLAALADLGWRTKVSWECEQRRLDELADALANWVRNGA